jgi:hypothetical protein
VFTINSILICTTEYHTNKRTQKMKFKLFLLLVSVLVIGNLFAAPVTIASLPFAITTPGTYILGSNLTYTGTGTAISILGNLTGPVILNLKSHTITGSSNPGPTANFSVAVFISGNGPGVSSITIENGSITHFGFGVWAQPNNGGSSSTTTNNFSSIDVQKLAISFTLTPASDGACILFDGVDSSSVSNCIFSSSDFGIEDVVSNGGNRYTNISFTNVGRTVSVLGGSASTVLDHCQFSNPAN